MKDKRKLPAILLIVLIVVVAIVIVIRISEPKDEANPLNSDLSPTTIIGTSPAPPETPTPVVTPASTQTTTPITTPALTPTLTQDPTTTLTTTPAPTTTPTKTPDTTRTPTPTKTTTPPSPFQGSLAGIWSGNILSTPPTPISGIFSISINAKGEIRGSFSGSFSGNVAGNVDLGGNLEAKGTASGGTTTFMTYWQGQLSVSGNTLTFQNGTLSGEYVLGTFSGTGIAIH
jgi:hypothetical protein